MTNRLIDVLDSRNAVLHTFPITIEGADPNPSDSQYEEKALMAAAYEHLVPDADHKNLTTRVHVSRGGQLKPYGDNCDTLSQTKQSLEQAVRERAYFLWRLDGCKQSIADEYWHRAHDEHLRERAYVLWQQEGCPEGQADEYWHRTREFEGP